MKNKINKAKNLLLKNCSQDVRNEEVPHGWIDDSTYWFILNEKDLSWKVHVKNLDGSLNKVWTFNKSFEILKSVSRICLKSNNMFLIDDEFEVEINLDSKKIFKKNRIQYQNFKSSYSPSKNFVAYKKGYNIEVLNLLSNQIIGSTIDGKEGSSYCSESGNNNTFLRDKINGEKRPLNVKWLEKSNWLIFYKLIDYQVYSLNINQSMFDNNNQERPISHDIKYALPGDKHVPKVQLFAMCLETGNIHQADLPDLPYNFTPPFFDNFEKVFETGDETELLVPILDRNYKKLNIYKWNIEKNITQNILSESTNSFLFYDSFGEIDGYEDKGFPIFVFKNYFIWKTIDRDYYHLELRSLNDGKLIKPLTNGNYNVERLLFVSEEKLLFTCSNVEGEHPYYEFLFTLDLKNNKLKRLTFENADHLLKVSPNGEHYFDSYSRVDLPPKLVLKKDEKIIDVIVQADISRLMEKGYVLPKSLLIYNSELKQNIVTILIEPNVDSKKSPLIDYVYGGPQTVNVPKRFSTKQSYGDPLGFLQSFSQLGIGGIIIDGRGTPRRTKSFHDWSYKNLQACAGLNDHPWAILELSKKVDWIDMNKIGVWGSSGGGYATVRALVEYPEIYKVGVSIAGNHEQYLYNYTWVERYNGGYDKKLLQKQSNSSIINKLSHPLLLIHGELDDNVHLSHSLILYNQGLVHNKNVELSVLLGEFHDVALSKVAIDKMFNFFIKHLLNEEVD